MAWNMIHAEASAQLRSSVTWRFDSVVSDLPAGISMRGQRWDSSHGGRAGWVRKYAGILGLARERATPGSYGLFWSYPRTQHWTGCAVEDGGWEILDLVTHLQAQGKPATALRLKPMAEQWILARVPGPERPLNTEAMTMEGGRRVGNAWLSHTAACTVAACARGCVVAAVDAQAGIRKSGARRAGVRRGMGYGGARGDGGPAIEASSGLASRFFYVPKAKGAARPDDHIAIKPEDLMAILVAMVTPVGGWVLDPCAGTARTGVGAILTGRNFTGIEQDGNTVATACEELQRAEREVGE